ncbi:MAG: ATP-binding cassette domain-containing protein, partial [Defluviicoccus sp.]|nr:ATP-binding cassette domain-containing protein [Defluviicoccus sp.]
MQPTHAPAAGPALIEGRQLMLTRGRLLILDRIDIAVRTGEIVTIIGPNGAGKTTLLKVLLGLIA